MYRILLFILLTTSLFAKDIIAVLDLEQIGLTPQEATILTQRLTTELIFLDKYQIVERINMDKILKEQKFQKSGCTDSECAVEIGQLLNTDYIVIGNVSKFGSTWTLDARLIDVGLGKGVISAKFSKEGKIDVLLTMGITSIAKQLSDLSSDDAYMVENNSSSKQNEGSYKSKDVKVKGRRVFGLGLFSSSDQVVVDEPVKGGLLVAMFGGIDLNLIRAKLNKRKNVVYIFIAFGGATILVPKDMYVNTQVIPLFSGFSNKSKFVAEDKTQSDKKLIIRGIILFGGGSVKNKK
jgi:TolB-like protein